MNLAESLGTFGFPKTDQELRIVALWAALGCVDPDKGINPDNLVRLSETIVRYIKDGETPTKLVRVK